MNRCSKTGLTDQDFKTILDVLNVYDPGDIIDQIPAMGTPEFMQDVQSAFKAVLAHVNRTKCSSDLMQHVDKNPGNVEDDDLDAQDYIEADKQRDAEEHKLKEQAMNRLVHNMYIASLS